MTSQLAKQSLPVAGGGGIGAWTTSIATHRVSTTVLVTGTVVICLALVAHAVSKGLEWFYKHRKAIIEAQGVAEEKRIKAENLARSSKTREDARTQLLLKWVDDPVKGVYVERLLIAQALVDLSEGCELRGEEFRVYLEALAAYAQGGPLRRIGPDDGPNGELRRAGCGSGEVRPAQ
jgi:hypothetical protein